MDSLVNFGGSSLEWRQPKGMERYFELKNEEKLYATLRFRSSCGTLAEARTALGAWTYKRVGFLNTRVTVRTGGSEQDLALYQPQFWGDGPIAFSGGPSFGWKPASLWGTAWAFTGADGETVLRFNPEVQQEKLTDLFRTQVTVIFTPSSSRHIFFPILVSLGAVLISLAPG